MIEKLHAYSTGEGRGLGADITRDEPSHIHLPRRRRLARPVDESTSVTLVNGAGDDDRAAPAASD